MNKPNDTDGCFVTPNYSTSCFSNDDMLSKMKEISAKMRSQPNVFVTTKRTLVLLRKAIEAQEERFVSDAIPMAFIGTPIGTPIEDYATVRECLDRMMDGRDGERLQLVLSEEIPPQCMDHPWMKQRLKEIVDKL